MSAEDFTQVADPYRRELLAHCYRMLGSFHDAEDLVQETLLRAWRGYDHFDGRSSVRTWLYRIATNACLSALKSRQRRILPSDLGEAGGSREADLTRADGLPWLEPVPTGAVLERPDDPAAVAALREGTRLALVAAFQRLPARQRAVLILVEVVGLRLAEAAAVLEISTDAARSLVQRARATLSIEGPRPDELSVRADAEILDRYLAAFENADTEALTALLRDSVEYEMPPIPAWFRGRAEVLDHHVRRVFGHPRRAVATNANGYPALASYSRDVEGTFRAHAIHVLEVDGGQVARVVVFLDPDLFARFGLPEVLEPAS
ncbi:MAG TPA: RNA polymerase subunit sigma-70 [Mycobacteriales bacterium]|nr:RNA polymerase subunit sigma-70 [Mycobacteriales bacterium]